MKKVVRIGKRELCTITWMMKTMDGFTEKELTMISLSPATRKLIEKGLKVKVSKLEKADQ